MRNYAEKLSDLRALQAKTRTAFVVLKLNYLEFFKAVNVDSKYLEVINSCETFYDLCTAVDRMYRILDQEIDSATAYLRKLEQKNNEVLEMRKSLNRSK